MNGGILSRLFGKIAGNLGDDAGRSVLASLTNTPAKAGILSQLKNGVALERPINLSIAAGNDALTGATDLALRGGGVKNKLIDIGQNIEQAGAKLRNNSLLSSITDKKVLERAPQSIDHMTKYGFNTNQYEDVANILTGKDGILNKFNTNALERAQMSALLPENARADAIKQIERSIDLKPSQKKTLIGVLQQAEDNATGNMLNRLNERGVKRAAGIGEVDIADMHNMVQDLENYAYNEISGKGSDAARKAIRSYTSKIKDQINGLSADIYKDPDNIRQLSEALLGANLSPQLNKDIIDQIRKGVTYTDMRGLQSPYVTAGQIARARKEAPLRGGVNGSGAGGVLGPAVGEVVNEVVGKPLAAGAGRAVQIGGRGVQLAAKNGGKIAKYGAAGLGGLAILNGLTNGNGGNNQSMTDPTMMMAGAGMDNGNGTNRTGAAKTPSAEPTVAGYSRTQLENAYVAALMDNNLEAAKAIGTMIDMADSKQARADKLETTGTKSKQATQSANAARMMNNLMQTYQRGGGAQGGVGALNGLLNKVTFGAYNPNQAAYENMLQAAAVAVARANGEVGVLSNQDIQNYKNMLPTFADNPQQAQIKLQTIMSGLQGME